MVTFFGDLLKMSDVAKWIDKIGNKKMFALLFAAGAITNAAFVSWISAFLHRDKK